MLFTITHIGMQLQTKLHTKPLGLILFISLMISAKGLTAQQLSVSFQSDTLIVCEMEAFEIAPEYQGGVQPYTYEWSTGDTTASIEYLPYTTLDSLWVFVTDAAGAQDSARLVVWALDECVWPGDANGDGKATNLDLLYIGKALGASGATRPNAHLNWVAQPAHQWGHSFPAGVNYVHADGDGNGIVDTADVAAIRNNYLTPAKPVSTTTGGVNSIPISVEYSKVNAYPGDTVTIDISMGSPTLPVDSIAGVAFSIQFDSYLIDSNSVVLDYGRSWFGETDQTMKTIEKVFGSQIDVGMIRVDKQPVKGSGTLIGITVVIDDVVGKRAGIEIISFDLMGASVRTSSGRELPVVINNAPLGVVLSNDNSLEVARQFDVYVTEQTLQVEGPVIEIEGLQVMDIQGRVMSRKLGMVRGGTYTYSLAHLPKGLYVVSIQTDKGSFQQKIVIR